MSRSFVARLPQVIGSYIVLVLNPHITRSFITEFPQIIIILISRVNIKIVCYIELPIVTSK